MSAKGENLKKLTEKKPVLFYYEEAVSAWIPWADGYDFNELLNDLDEGESFELKFRRKDMSQLDMEALPDG